MYLCLSLLNSCSIACKLWILFQHFVSPLFQLHKWSVTILEKVSLFFSCYHIIGHDNTKMLNLLPPFPLPIRRAFEAHSFPACVLESTAAKRLGITGQCWLRIVHDEIALVDPVSWEVLCEWPLRTIRSYGKNKDVFSFEAGESAGPMRGIFYVASEHAGEIFHHVSVFTDKIAGKGPTPALLRFTNETRQDDYGEAGNKGNSWSRRMPGHFISTLH